MRKTKQSESANSLPKIGAPATRALAAAGYHQLAQLARANAADLLQLHGMGPKAIRILRQALQEEGLSFLDEQSDIQSSQV